MPSKSVGFISLNIPPPVQPPTMRVLMTENAIVYIVKGNKEISIDGTTFSVAAGELFMLPQGKYAMSEYLPQNGEFKSIMLCFQLPPHCRYTPQPI